MCSFWQVEEVEVEVVAKRQPPAKTSTYASFRRWKRWWWRSEAVSCCKTSAHGTFPRVEEVAVLAKSLHHQIQVHTARWWCSPLSDTSIHSSCGGGGGVGKESPPSDTSAHSSWGGGGGVLCWIRVYMAHVGVEEMVVFSIVEYECTRLVWRRWWCWQRVEYQAHIAFEEELVVLAKSLHPWKQVYAARFKGWRRWW